MDTIGISYGRFNPPHKGHKAVWEQAANCDHYYIGTNPNTIGKKDPIPYDIKIHLMSLICPIIKNNILSEQNLFTLATTVYKLHGENNELHIFTDEQWLFNALIKYNGVESTHGYYKFKKLLNIQTDRVSSSTSLRNAVKEGNKNLFYEVSGMPEDAEITINNRIYKFFDIVEEFIL